MASWIRRRLRDDAGLTLIEVLVALVVLTIALTALASGLITSARSLSDQKARSAATRVGTAALESLRGLGYEQVVVNDGLGVYDAPSTITREGIDYTVDTDVEVVDAGTLGAPVEDKPKLLQVETTVSWQVQGRNVTQRFTTSIRPDEHRHDPDAQEIVAINVNPNPTVVDKKGNPTDDLYVKVVLRGYDDSALVAFKWTNDDGTPKSRTLTSDDGGVTWTGTIDDASVYKQVAVDDDGVLEFKVVAGALEQLYTLPLYGPSSTPPPDITLTDISPTPIIVRPHTGDCTEGTNCTNTSAITFTAKVTGLNTTPGPDGEIIDTVRVKYERVDGQFDEVPMTYDADLGVWELTLDADSTRFKTGSSQPFYFTALRIGTETVAPSADTEIVYVSVLEGGF